ncbi:Glia-derived nexin [Thelohanellus kitauei]|uniref:Glia-derived nexin n=1 Tax=Thelohanellus kitauei TaxID=669202 RepID=A0A0C2JU80_THEKT|nr:Glia-derived nexin [Thelohanellus kitauei]
MNEERENLIYESDDHNFRIHFKYLYRRQFVSVIVLPNEGQRIGEVLKDFNFNKIKDYFDSAEKKNVNLKLPKFKIFSQNNLIDTLKTHGVTDIFDRNLSNFEMMTNHSVYITHLMQATNVGIDDVDVRKSGKKVKKLKIRPKPIKFHVTRPFLFLVNYLPRNVVLISAVVTNATAA